MLRTIVATGLILALIGIAVFGTRLLDDLGQKQMGDNPALRETCNLLKQDACGWSTETADWKVTLNALEEGSQSGQNKEYRLTVVTSERPERFLAVLRGESMYMGEYPVPLGRQTGDEYTARFTAPLCTVDDTMIWRIDLQQGQAPIKPMPLKLVFQADPG